jgi:hypothetical protein
MRETELVKLVLLALGKRTDLRVWRQNVGALRDINGRMVKFGVPGAADISGILVDGRRLEIECKVGTRQRPEQKNFERMILQFGGVYLLVHSVEEAVQGVEKALREGG